MLGLLVAARGDASIMVGLGIYKGMKACMSEAWVSDFLTGKKIVMQGFGKVAFNTAHHLLKEDAALVVADIYEIPLDRAKDLVIKVVDQEKSLIWTTISSLPVL